MVQNTKPKRSGAAGSLNNKDTAGAETGKSVEERLQPWLDEAEALILLVLALIAWSAVVVNVLGRIVDRLENGSNVGLTITGILLGSLVVYGALYYIFFSLRALQMAKRVVAFFQRSWWLTLPILVILALFIQLQMKDGFWTAYPLAQVGLLATIVLFAFVVLATKPLPDAPFQLWRKVVLSVVGVLFAAELALQGAAFAGVLPVNINAGVGVSNGRVYNYVESPNYGSTNQYGWHYPEFRLEDGERRILLNGDSFVQALQIPAEQHMGKQLEGLLNGEAADTSTEVIAQGMPGYGANMYLNDHFSSYIWEPVAPDEVIVFFHLVNDFQFESMLDDRIAVAVLRSETDEPADETDQVFIRDENFGAYHSLAHHVIGGHDPTNPYLVLRTHSLLYHVTKNYISRPRLPQAILNMDAATVEAPFGPATMLYLPGSVDAGEVEYVFEITRATLSDFVLAMEQIDATVKLVTIPYFPAEFYERTTGQDWDAMLGDYDLALPERELREISEQMDIQFLGMLDYLNAGGTPAETIQSYFFEDGVGHLTETGHKAFAAAVYDCFYSDAPSSGCAAPQ